MPVSFIRAHRMPSLKDLASGFNELAPGRPSHRREASLGIAAWTRGRAIGAGNALRGGWQRNPEFRISCFELRFSTFASRGRRCRQEMLVGDRGFEPLTSTV